MNKNMHIIRVKLDNFLRNGHDKMQDDQIVNINNKVFYRVLMYHNPFFLIK